VRRSGHGARDRWPTDPGTGGPRLGFGGTDRLTGPECARISHEIMDDEQRERRELTSPSLFLWLAWFSRHKAFVALSCIFVMNLSSFLWSVADLLRGKYRPHEYGKVILPFTVLRRMDCVLAPTKAAVLAEAKKQVGTAGLTIVIAAVSKRLLFANGKRLLPRHGPPVPQRARPSVASYFGTTALCDSLGLHPQTRPQSLNYIW
jgi:hypothetical protein